MRNRLGIMEFQICLPHGGYLQITADIVNADIPLLLGVDYLDHAGLLCDTQKNELKCK